MEHGVELIVEYMVEFDFINELCYNFLMIVNPIKEETLNLFFGRKEELEFLEYTLGLNLYL